MGKFKITVVTICYNEEFTIEDTIKSVLSQTYDNIEYIVVDGASLDRTLSIINGYKSRIDTLISGPDKGIYDAMNKGINLATGDYVIFMNSGDEFDSDSSISSIFDNLNKDADVVYGNSVFRYENGNRIVKAEPLHRLKYKLPFSHQSVFVRTQLMKTIPFNLNYKLAADYDFFLMAYQNHRRFSYFPVVVGNVRIDDGNSYQHFYKSKKEVKQIQLSHGYPKTFVCYDYYKEIIWYSFKIFVKKIISNKLYNKIVTR